jgi:hypothetical protein
VSEVEANAAAPASEPPDDGLETTEEELSSFRIVQAIAAQVGDPSRITIRDAKSYCAVLFDDNSRKQVCLWLRVGADYYSRRWFEFPTCLKRRSKR